MRYPVPRQTMEAWEKYKDMGPHNPGLIFDRFVPDWGVGEGKDIKKRAWDEILSPMGRPDKDLHKAWRNRWEVAVRAAGGELFSLKTQWRLAVGLGCKGPLEAGFTFNRYGFPFIPGSSLKGIARTWGLLTIGEKVGAQQLEALDKILSVDEEKSRDFCEVFLEKYPGCTPEVLTLVLGFRAIFGTSGQSGKVIVFDAVPADVPHLELDVMNPHYADYYHGKSWPASWLSPSPVFFVTVAPGTEFLFALGLRKSSDICNKRFQDLAKEWLVNGLMRLGAGAKTAAGYGHFDEPMVIS